MEYSSRWVHLCWVRVGLVDFMLFVYISFALGCQQDTVSGGILASVVLASIHLPCITKKINISIILNVTPHHQMRHKSHRKVLSKWLNKEK